MQSKYHRLKARSGVKQATVAIADKILVAAFHTPAEGTVYEDLGAGYLDALSRTRTSKHFVRRLEAARFPRRHRTCTA